MPRSTTVALILAFAAAPLGACRAGGSGSVDGGGGGGIDARVGPDAQDGVGCGAYTPRTPVAEVFIGPDGLEQRLIDEMDSATQRLDVLMYLMTENSFVNAIERAHSRGVAVRVMLDFDHAGNDNARSELLTAGVPLHDAAPIGFTHAHTKSIVVDDHAVIMSANLIYNSMHLERNYGVIDRDPEDVGDLENIIDSDWAADGSYPDLACTRLIVSPVNSRQRLLDHINGAQQTLDLTIMYITDSGVLQAIIDRYQAGVAVRVLLADPTDITSNVDTITTLQNANVPVRVMKAFQLHAKMIVADGVPFVGSENLSSTSLTRNREVGVMVDDDTQAAKIRTQVDADWNLGVAP